MNTEFCVLRNDEQDKSIYERAGRVIKEGGLVAFPTETVYGLGGDALNGAAAAKIYEAKGRPSDNPLIVHIAEFEALNKIVKNIPENAKKLADAFWPGPLTMIFEKKEIVPLSTTGGLNTVAVRMPNHAAALAFIKETTGYVAAPSANLSGRPSPTLAKHVQEDLEGRIDMILDGGAVGIGVESTIVDLTGEVPTLLRPGYINIQMLEEIVGRVDVDPGIGGSLENGVAPKAPGMKYKHYAPKGELYIVQGDTDKINQVIERALAAGEKVGVIATEENIDKYIGGIVKCVGTRADEETIARHLFEVLRDFDTLGVTVIYSEDLNTPKMGMAVMNRLLKAAGHKVIK